MIPHILIVLFSLSVGEDRLDAQTIRFKSLETCQIAGEKIKARWTQERPLVKLEIGYVCLEE